MKVSKAKAVANRSAIIRAAERLFREHGFSGVSLAEITQSAGLTHGAFYGHFDSKDALAAEACGAALEASRERAKGCKSLLGYATTYLTEERRDRPEIGCALPAYVTEVCRQGAAVQTSFARGLARALDSLEDLAKDSDQEAGRSRAFIVMAAVVGGMSLARATATAAPELSAEILLRVQGELERVFGTSDGLSQAAEPSPAIT